MSHRSKIFSKLVVACVFAIGFVMFFLFSYRFGWRPESWRFVGSDRALHLAIQTCFHGNDNERTQFMICAEKKLVKYVKRWGVDGLMHALEYRLGSQSTDRNFTQCHDLAHAIGWAGTINTRNLQTTLPLCTNTCVSGCQHGAVSAWYSIGKNIHEQLSTLCTEGIDWSKNPQGQGGCFHELGHAIASVASFDLKKSLILCDKIISKGRIDCAAGVFMEMFEAATFATAPQPLPDNHPAWCDDLWSPYDEYCYNQAGSYEYARTQGDQKAFATCQLVPERYRSTCVSGVSQNIFYVYQHKVDHLFEIEAFCRRAGVQMFSDCLVGLITSSVFVEPDIKTAISLCLALAPNEQSSCFVSLGRVLSSKRTDSEALRLCRTVPMSQRESCMIGLE